MTSFQECSSDFSRLCFEIAQEPNIHQSLRCTVKYDVGYDQLLLPSCRSHRFPDVSSCWKLQSSTMSCSIPAQSSKDMQLSYQTLKKLLKTFFTRNLGVRTPASLNLQVIKFPSFFSAWFQVSFDLNFTAPQ
jgi:hypothetical protein